MLYSAFTDTRVTVQYRLIHEGDLIVFLPTPGSPYSTYLYLKVIKECLYRHQGHRVVKAYAKGDQRVLLPTPGSPCCTDLYKR